MERAIGTTFKVGNDEIIVKETERPVCIDDNGIRCYFFKACFTQLCDRNKGGQCIKFFRKDGKNVVFIKK